MEPPRTRWPSDTAPGQPSGTLRGMERASLPRPVTDGNPRTRPGRIRGMVVDDNAGFRESLLSLLDAGGLDVVGEAPSGFAALEMADGLDPDVVLMDVRMPGIDGIETTRRLTARYPGLGLGALSGHADQESGNE